MKCPNVVPASECEQKLQPNASEFKYIQALLADSRYH